MGKTLAEGVMPSTPLKIWESALRQRIQRFRPTTEACHEAAARWSLWKYIPAPALPMSKKFH